MTNRRVLLALAPLCLLALNACDAGGGGSPTGAAGTSGAAGNTSGAAGNASGAAGNTSGAAGETSGAAGNTSGAAGDPSGGAGASGVAGTNGGVAGTTGNAGTNGGAGMTGAAGTTGKAGTGGGAGTTGKAGTGGGAGVGAAGAGAAGTTGAAGTGGGNFPPKPTGNSAGCGKSPPGVDSTTKFALHEVSNINVNAVYKTGGMYYKNSGKYDFTLRPYAVKLPTGYDTNKPYIVTFGGGGCGGNASNFASGPGGGFGLGGTVNADAIQVGLSYINTCFDDGGPAIGNRDDTPDLPYFRAVLAQVEADYCIDKSKVFVAGYSSGAWEAYTLGCAAGDVVRGIAADEGGMRATRPPCTGKVAALLVAGEADTENPIGPLPPTDGAYKRLGSPGSGPGRDELLMRNGCTGTETVGYDPAYGQCKKYTGCPANYPVVWCSLPGVGHNASSYGGVNYSPGPMWKFLSTLPAP